MKLRLAEPAVLIDIQRVEGLKGISESDGKLVIGALATHHELESSGPREPEGADTGSDRGGDW